MNKFNRMSLKWTILMNKKSLGPHKISVMIKDLIVI